MAHYTKLYRVCEEVLPPPTYSYSTYVILEFILALIVMAIVVTVLFLIVCFLLDVRSQNSKSHYRIFLALWTTFLLLLGWVVGDFVGPRISQETGNKILTIGLMILLVFLGLYNTLAYCDDAVIEIKSKRKKKKNQNKSRKQAKSLKEVEEATKEEDEETRAKLKKEIEAELAGVVVHVHAEVDVNPPEYWELYPPPPYSAALQSLQSQAEKGIQT